MLIFEILQRYTYKYMYTIHDNNCVLTKETSRSPVPLYNMYSSN